MIATWMISAVVFTALLGVAAFCAEPALRGARRPARWPWLVALAIAVAWPAIAPLARRSVPTTGTIHAVTTTLPTIEVVPDQVPAMPWTQRLDIVLLTLWAAASAMMFARLVHALIVVSRIRRASRAQTVDGMPVLVTADAGPAVIGVIRTSVLFPADLLDLEAPLRRLVLRHEDEHRRAGDPWIVLWSAIAIAAVPWNLPLWWIVRRARLALEMDCDARVLAHDSNATQYGKLLLLISQRQTGNTLAPMLALSRSHLERRIAAMLTIGQDRQRTRILVAAVATVVVGVVACSSRIGDAVTAPAPGVAARSGAVDPNAAYFEFQVNTQVKQIAGTGNVRYPDTLRVAHVEGEVLAQFVVDTNGLVVPGTLKVLKSDHEMFTRAVASALPNMRFVPAELTGQKVKQVVQQPFSFSLSKNDGATTQMRGGQPVTATNKAGPFHEFQLTRRATQIPGTGNLRYPDSLRTANVEGEVLAQFVVGENGEVDPSTFKVLRSTHPMFSRSVELALPRMRFTPAESNGTKVKMLMQQPFTFSLSKN